MKIWRLWLLSVIPSVLLTEVIVSAMGLLLKGEIPPDYLLTGLVASLLVASLIVAIVGNLLKIVTGSQLQLQAILNSVAAKIAVLDRDGVILAVNEPWRRFAQENGIEPGKPVSGASIGANYLTVCQAGTGFETDGELDAGNGIRAVLDGRLPGFICEYPCHSQQKQCWFSMSVTPLGEAAPDGVVISHTDITARRQAEEALRIAAIAFECQEGIVVMDATLKILRVNQASTQITGYSQQEVQGKTTAILRSGRHPASFYDEFWSEAKRAERWQGKLWLRRRNGEEFAAQASITAVRDESGQVTHYVGTLIDTTNRQLQDQQRVLNEAAHRNLLVREVHHRIKNNLQGITGILRQFAQKHPETANPIQQVISQVQSIAVIHGLQGRTSLAMVRLCELTLAIANGVESLWRKSISVKIPAAWTPCTIMEAEAVPLALVLNELISNAVKHGEYNEPIIITLRHEPSPEAILVSIKNAGQLPPDFDQNNFQNDGLKLVASLLPRNGARLSWQQQGNTVITLLELDVPVIMLESRMNAENVKQPISYQ